MSRISTHVLDTVSGKPAVGIVVHLWRDGVAIGSATTDQNGRCAALLSPDQTLLTGIYQLTFEIANYHPNGFYPQVSISFQVFDLSSHYHIPLLLSPFGFTTYRGS